MAFSHANAEPFTAIFDSSGRLVRSVRLLDDVSAAPVAHRPPPPPKPGADKEPQDNGSSLLACADNQGNFSFLGEGTDGRLEVTTYSQH